MVKSGKFSLEVLVGGVPLTELTTEAGVTYVETRYDTPSTYKVTKKETDPYGEVYDQAWPVTPYTLRVRNGSGDKVHATVYIDGAVALKQFVDAEAELKGFRATYLVCVARAERAAHPGELLSDAAPLLSAPQRRPVQGVHLHGASPAA